MTRKEDVICSFCERKACGRIVLQTFSGDESVHYNIIYWSGPACKICLRIFSSFEVLKSVLKRSRSRNRKPRRKS